MNQTTELEKRLAELETKVEASASFERWLRIFSMMGAVVVFALGIWQYRDTKEQEFRKAFWEKQFELYSKVTAAAAEIALGRDVDSVAAARKVFWELYWGQLSVVENREVADAMVAFGVSLSAWEHPVKSTAMPQELPGLSYGLARACRNSLKATWEPAKIDDIPIERR